MEDEDADEESSLLFEVAIGRNEGRPGLEQRYAVETVWRQIAAGTLGKFEREEWMTHVAQRLVERVIDNPSLDAKHRGSEALSALGLWGRRAVHSELISDLQTLLEFADLISPERELTYEEIANLLAKREHFRDLSFAQAVKLVRNLVQNRLR